jgi:two-component system nitrogen regulation response regulator NtrX
MPTARILVVDDEKNIRRSLEMICTGEGHKVQTAEDAESALKAVEGTSFDLIMLDIMMPGMDGLTLLKEVRKRSPAAQVIMISGHASVQNAVTATKEGAFDFMEKPISKEKLLISINNALQNRSLQQENIALRKQITGKYEMVGDSPGMQNLLQQIAKVAPTNGRVLITGESGSGKELIARAIHENSLRKSGPFIKVNCAAIPEELIESELFGSERGAYTGAHETREGKFSLADSGTLFLDEVGDMSLKVQAKVLRVLQEGEFEKVGGNKTQVVDVRVVAATNKNLEEEIRAGNFREDLYFRLNVVPILSLPLRQRNPDIPQLARRFMQLYAEENGTRMKQLSDAALNALTHYDWPGNIRELRNVIERMMIMCSSEVIEASDLPMNVSQPSFRVSQDIAAGMTLQQAREQIEREFIEASLKRNQWNISQTARELDVDRTNLHKKIKAYNLSGQ